MRIQTLVAENFRAFPRLSLELHPAFTLIVGANGAGKSSVLDALAVAIGAWLLGFPEVGKRPIERDEMRRVVRTLGGDDGLELAGATTVTATGTLPGGDPVEWSRSLQSPTGHTSFGQAGAMKRAAEQAQAAVSAGAPVHLPVLAYYGTGRLWDQKRDTAASARAELLGSRLQGYAACLERASSIKHLESWMRWREERRLEVVAEGGTPALDPQLEAVRAAACACVDGSRRFYYSFRHKELRFEAEDGAITPFSLLSDGYRNLLGVAADIAWRAARLNPQLGADAARAAHGVVLIDEIDLHLHPAWQRRVVGDLRRAFPNIQFVATTHSPQVVSTVPAASLRLLTREGDVRAVLHAEGRDSNSLLEDLFGVPERPPEAQRAIGHLFGLIDAKRWDEAAVTLERLRSTLGPADPDLIRAQAVLDLERVLLDAPPTEA
jgi:predicted ATP-binding protein involved in virulence